jgi:hypothetical protein
VEAPLRGLRPPASLWRHFELAAHPDHRHIRWRGSARLAPSGFASPPAGRVTARSRATSKRRHSEQLRPRRGPARPTPSRRFALRSDESASVSDCRAPELPRRSSKGAGARQPAQSLRRFRHAVSALRAPPQGRNSARAVTPRDCVAQPPGPPSRAAPVAAPPLPLSGFAVRTTSLRFSSDDRGGERRLLEA